MMSPDWFSQRGIDSLPVSTVAFPLSVIGRPQKLLLAAGNILRARPTTKA
jgi:hypothetical protein